MAAVLEDPTTVKQLIGTVHVRSGEDDGEVEVAMSTADGPWGSIHEPIRGSLTLSSLITSNSGISPGTTVDNASNIDWQYIQGAI